MNTFRRRGLKQEAVRTPSGFVSGVVPADETPKPPPQQSCFDDSFDSVIDPRREHTLRSVRVVDVYPPVLRLQVQSPPGERRLSLDLKASVNYTIQVRCSALSEPPLWSEWSEPYHIFLHSKSPFPVVYVGKHTAISHNIMTVS